ncbi:undecaprenyl-diphosphatase [Propionibacteriaceae bacterium ES.041]|uniref:undecaprenyl-diphosphate phosphatase n=1 Tax=Enemella evansiae TaxID=2016499 RepID=UPI000B963ECC|nr:undecaprenyl-diphosphate phosphatase [Enemella evansiae]OYO15135.1 undecaprenyl-diphosphatase [Enemella evansiae]OYO20206.1 undecaprenyl-diphosphatase [Enemella evansiae]PFG66809.1 undecaprenyl-diphosphatase [Propionibacteriaceae bacterium ES.041]
MDWLDAIVLGIVQGLTEFLPISSSAHQSIVGQLLGGVDPGAAFTAITQLGTETAVVIYFARDIGRIIKHWALSLIGRVPRSDPDARMGWLIIIGSIPIGILGVLFENAIDSNLRNLWITVAMLAGFAIVIAVADRVARNEKTLDQLTWRDGILYGLFQAMALIPGVSRSGGTIAGGLFMGYTREAAARYSFLLAIPAVYLSGLFKLKDVFAEPAAPWGPIIVATILAFVIGLAVIHWLLRYVSKHNFTIFVIYRLVLAAVVAGLLLAGVLQPMAQG